MRFVYELWAAYFSSVTLAICVNLTVSLCPVLLCGVSSILSTFSWLLVFISDLLDS